MKDILFGSLYYVVCTCFYSMLHLQKGGGGEVEH